MRNHKRIYRERLTSDELKLLSKKELRKEMSIDYSVWTIEEYEEIKKRDKNDLLPF